MATVLICLALNIAAFFYLQAWTPIVNFVKAFRGARQIKAFRVAGLLVLTATILIAVPSVHAQTVKVWKGDKRCPGCTGLIVHQPIVAGVIRDQDYENAIAIAKANGIKVEANEWEWNAQMGNVQYSKGEDKLVQKWVPTPDGITGVPTIDKALLYVWNNCGRLMVVFLLLAAASMLNSKLKADNECHGDVLRREAAERWEEENDDDSMHNPFDSPEGMQPSSQYVPVRSKR